VKRDWWRRLERQTQLKEKDIINKWEQKNVNILYSLLNDNNYMYHRGPGSWVSIATEHGLDGPGIESRWGWDFLNCLDRPWGPPSLLYNGYRVFPEGRQRPGRDADSSPPLVSRSKKRVGLYRYFP
jgi:hypothetical protein